MSKKAKWRVVGHRSLRHQDYPALVVRFTNGGGKAKLLHPHTDFVMQEAALGRDGKAIILGLVKEAESEWRMINNNTERKV